MDLPYKIYDPTRNITALVTAPVPRALYHQAAAALMAQRPEVEQVGFLETPAAPAARIRLQMMGGEFCGNAAMSAAAYLAEQDAASAGRPGNTCFAAEIPLEVSGAEHLVTCGISRQAQGGFRGTVAMPLPERMGQADIPLPGGAAASVPAVFLPGIVHCIVPGGALTRRQAEAAIRPLCASLRAAACGILLFDRKALSFAPLVYVASTDTAVWESGCGSGSAALGAYLAAQAGGRISLSLRQPGGMMDVSAAWDGGAVTDLSISGRVRFAGAGVLTL